MFNFNKSKKEETVKTDNSLEIKKKYENQIEEIKRENALKVKEIEANHRLEIKQKEFDLTHFKDEEVQTVQKQLNEANKHVAVLEAEKKMLDRIVDLNADVIDVKNLVKNLIDKLPTVNLTGTIKGK